MEKRKHLIIHATDGNYSAGFLLKCLKWCKENPDATVTVRKNTDGWHDEKMTGAGWREWFKKCLHKKINRNEPTRGRKDDGDYENKLWILSRQLNSRVVTYWRDVPKKYWCRLGRRLKFSYNWEE